MEGHSAAEGSTLIWMTEPASEYVDDLRDKLVARLDRCFDRLEDAISELVALHDVDAELILDRVEAAIAAEQQESPV